MERVYSFVDALVPIQHKIKLLQDVIRNILNYTVECAQYIQQYAQRGFGSKCDGN